MKPLKVLDLFSGIGGFSLGLERTGGFKTVAFCENDPFCQKVLQKHWPSVPIYNNIINLNHQEQVDVITGGYPCQPFSVAGKRKGHADDRHLWPHMFKVITQKRPSWVLLENVIGHLTLGINGVLLDLEGEGYTTRPIVLPAASVNANHLRNRVFVIAYSGITRCEEISGLEQKTTGSKGVRPSDQIDTKFISKRSERRRWRRENWWKKKSPEPLICGMANGIPQRVDRLRTLGAAVVPQVVEQIGNSMLATYR